MSARCVTQRTQARCRPAKIASMSVPANQISTDAPDEIGRQLRLRDLGGIIVVDFIDMVSSKHRRDVEKKMRDAMRNALAGNEAILPSRPMEWVYSKDAARGTVLALKAKDLGSRIFNVTMGSLTNPDDMAAAVTRVVPGAKIKFDTPKASALSLPNVGHASDQTTVKAVLGYEPKFKLADAVADLTEWMKKFPG